MKANPRINFDSSTDYQLPPGELWWLCVFVEHLPNFRIPARVSILMCAPDIQTWYTANQKAQIAIREYFGGDCVIPAYKVTLWQPVDKSAT
jgi:hypothetical protein